LDASATERKRETLAAARRVGVGWLEGKGREGKGREGKGREQVKLGLVWMLSDSPQSTCVGVDWDGI